MGLSITSPDFERLAKALGKVDVEQVYRLAARQVATEELLPRIKRQATAAGMPAEVVAALRVYTEDDGTVVVGVPGWDRHAKALREAEYGTVDKAPNAAIRTTVIEGQKQLQRRFAAALTKTLREATR